MILHALRVLTVLALVADPIIRNRVKVIESTKSLVSHTILFGDELLLASCNACKSHTVLASNDYGIAQKMYIWVAYGSTYISIRVIVNPNNIFLCLMADAWTIFSFHLNKDFFSF